MGLLDRLRTELIDIVEWIDDSQHTLVWRFPRFRNQIKQGAKLIVRPGQVAVFVHQGQLADVFMPGTHELRTGNLPLLSTLAGWKYGFDSPIKSEVYFVSTRQLTDLKWGTPNPIMLRDPDFGPIRLRAFGTYTLRASNPEALLTELVGTDGSFEAEEVTELLRSIVAESFASVVGESQIAALDLASNYSALAARVRAEVEKRVDDEYGLEIPGLFIVNISLPEEVEKAMDTRSSMGVIGDMNAFQQYQMGQAMTAAANNPAGGGAAEGMGLGMGLAMASRMMGGNPLGGMVGQPMAGPAMGAGMGAGMAGAVPPPPPPPPVAWHVAAGGATQGPFGAGQMMSMIQQGRLTASTMVWTAGMAGWAPAGQVPQLAAAFAASAPPPPPPPPPAG
ncbi:MAG: SPFH domain-containing protein [Phycisphaerales bacterium]